MTIGSHFLEGTVVELKKPLLVIQQSCTKGDEAVSSNEHEHGKNNYSVVGVVKKRYLFRSRPKPVATNK